MIFLWTTTKFGKIWLDGDEFRHEVTKRLPDGYLCQDMSFVGDQNLFNMYISLPDNETQEARAMLVDKFESFFRPMGIAVHLHWTRQDPDEQQSQDVWRKPPFWGAVCGGVVGISNLGLVGIAWTAAAAAVGFGVSWLALSKKGRSLVGSLLHRTKNSGR